MSTEILTARLEALERELQRAQEKTWLRPPAPGPMAVRRGLVEGLGTISAGAADLWQEVIDIRDELAAGGSLEKAWAKYAEVSLKSQQMFSELVEYIGGIAFRDTGLEYERICAVADELVRTCLQDATRNDTTGKGSEWISVPSLQESVTRTWIRMIRVRFPERTIWSLPFAIHEAGHVIMADPAGNLKKRVDRLVAQWVGDKVKLGKRVVDKEWAEIYLNELISDAFATFYLGPAYACAAVHLRFSPQLSAPPAELPHPSDSVRLHVILATLRSRDKESADGQYKEIIDRLEGTWNSMAAAPKGGAIDPATKERLDALVDEFVNRFSKALFVAEYPTSGAEGWGTATQWSSEWEKKEPTVTTSSTVRDALNAAWHFLLHHPEQYESITDRALTLCEAIIAKNKVQPAGNTVTA